MRENPVLEYIEDRGRAIQLELVHYPLKKARADKSATIKREPPAPRLLAYHALLTKKGEPSKIIKLYKFSDVKQAYLYAKSIGYQCVILNS